MPLRTFRVGRPGKGKSGPGDWETFEQEVRKGAERQARQRRGVPSAASLENLVHFKPGRKFLKPPEDRRCTFRNGEGVRCKNWAMKGANDRCHFHGGYRQNPGHKGTIAKLGLIESQTAHKQAAKQVYAKGRGEARAAARAQLKAHGLGMHNADILEGMEAHDMEDNGRSWRRWIKTLATRARQNRAKMRNGD